MRGRRGLEALRTLWGSGTTRTAAIVWDSIGTRNIGLISAGVAFFALLSLFPALTALVSVVGFLFDPAVADALRQYDVRGMGLRVSADIVAQRLFCYQR